MKKLYLIFLIPILGFISNNDCGIYRFDNKILIDKGGIEVFKSKAIKSSINKLVGYTRPDSKELGKNRVVDESHKVTITAYVIECGKEEDRDYHLVLRSSADKGGKTLIGEIPDPTCSKLKGFPGLQNTYKVCREFVEKEIDSSPSAVKPLPKGIKVTIVGIPFYDKIAHGTGHAENGIEIHPILSIKKEK